MTYAQKMAATLKDLKTYKLGLPPGDPDIAIAQAHIDWREARIAWNSADQTLMRVGPGSNPPGNPPPPPGA